MVDSKAPASQTLSRGIRVLEVLAAAHRPLSIEEIAGELGVHRSIAYRMLRTLESHRLISRQATGRYSPGAGLVVLAQSVERDLHTVSLPELASAAEDLGMTTFVAIDDEQECVTLVSVEPRHASGTVMQRPGTRHALTQGAPGVAILSARDEPVGAPGAGPAVEEARRLGYALSRGEVIPGVASVAVPMPTSGPARAAVAVVYVTSERPVEEIARRLTAAARAIGELVG
ncbi:helix-turn-helix domain-containing protein [Streptomyces sp. SID10853]|uniref:IclR family transcriptional regulator n=1 Tax=Streptomyces sp. SID10853 TaxID=2706028 RepID=UPI0013BFBCAE|nr:helix-turn-helix domain-containing protein [Streptomyces sp. SID10853]NDZ78163.1 helix-turn-helix domain-containing protein [Streptomyces sp. SID10853]